jgi:hypothetical protein
MNTDLQQEASSSQGQEGDTAAAATPLVGPDASELEERFRRLLASRHVHPAPSDFVPAAEAEAAAPSSTAAAATSRPGMSQRAVRGRARGPGMTAFGSDSSSPFEPVPPVSAATSAFVAAAARGQLPGLDQQPPVAAGGGAAGLSGDEPEALAHQDAAALLAGVARQTGESCACQA